MCVSEWVLVFLRTTEYLTLKNWVGRGISIRVDGDAWLIAVVYYLLPGKPAHRAVVSL